MSTWQSQLLGAFRQSSGMFLNSAGKPREVAIGARGSFKELFPLAIRDWENHSLICIIFSSFKTLQECYCIRFDLNYRYMGLGWDFMNKENKYLVTETLFRLRKSCFDKFGNVLVYSMSENITYCSSNLSCCYKITSS